MSTRFMQEGGCTCSDVRYRMIASPLIVHCCHCTWCQRETGASFALNALVETANVALVSGAPERVMTPSESNKGQTIIRCPACRVAVWSHYAGFGEDVAFVRVGTLDPGHGLEPGIHIYTATKQPWVVIPDGTPASDAYYHAREVWREDSLARLRSVRQST